MFDIIKKILAGDGQQGSVKDKVADPHIAICVLLLEAAHVDGECSAEEKSHLIATLSRDYGVNKEDIEDLVNRSDMRRKEATDLFRFTRYMNEHFTKEEKIKAMESVWRIILIDNQLESHEDHFAHKLANLLRLSHKELIDAKLEARKQLA